MLSVILYDILVGSLSDFYFLKIHPIFSIYLRFHHLLV